MRFAGVIIGTGAEAELRGLLRVALGGGREEGRGGWKGLLSVRVFGSRRMVRSASEKFGAGLSGLLFDICQTSWILEVACDRSAVLVNGLHNHVYRADVRCLRGLSSDG